MQTMMLTAISKEYLGFCPQKGYIYSVQTSLGNYHVVAILNNEVTQLISYTTN
jgi:hypothetical protein